jgi:hypothetical protein
VLPPTGPLARPNGPYLERTSSSVESNLVQNHVMNITQAGYVTSRHYTIEPGL